MSGTELIMGMGEVINYLKELEIKNKKLEEENKKLEEENEDNLASLNFYTEQCAELKDERKQLKEENKKLQEEIKELKEEFVDDSESEEEKTKYDGDDWAYGYGFTIKDGEYRICISGGGDHWTDYVMNKNGCFIDNKNEKKKVFTFVSCPEGNYIKVWDTPNMEGGLKLDEGEIDMYEMVKECYEEEIMNYESEEDSDEEEEESDEE